MSGVCLASSLPDQAAHLAPFRFTSRAATHAGCVRQLNEDNWLDRPDVGLWAVADGMGGHDAGDFAAATVVRMLSRVSDFGSAFAFRRSVRSALVSANNILQAHADDEVLGVIGSTVVALLVHGGHYACMWAGDSRAYVLRDGTLQRISRDHSLVQEMVDAGSLTPGEAKARHDSNVVTRAVGAAPHLELDGVYGRVQPGDRFILCSDGLCSVLTDDEVGAGLTDADLAATAEKLMLATLQRGAPDNVTFVVVDAS